jgi:hypothetical protein
MKNNYLINSKTDYKEINEILNEEGFGVHNRFEYRYGFFICIELKLHPEEATLLSLKGIKLRLLDRD